MKLVQIKESVVVLTEIQTIFVDDCDSSLNLLLRGAEDYESWDFKTADEAGREMKRVVQEMLNA